MKDKSFNEKGELKRSLGIIIMLAIFFFFFYGVNPFAEDAHYFSFSAWAYSVTCTLSNISEYSNYAYVSENSVYYNNASTGDFMVNVSASTTGGTNASIKNVTFPTTVSTGGNDSLDPYNWTYYWDNADKISYAPATVTCYNNWSDSNTTTFNVYWDNTAPSGGYVSYNNTNTSQTTQRINVSDGTDTGSGLLTAQLYRLDGNLSGGSCTYNTTYVAIGSSATGKTYVDDTTLQNAHCYKYVFNVTDRVNNVVSYTSSKEIKVDTTAPSCSVSAIEEPTAYGYASGTIMYYNNESYGNFSINVSVTDTGAGISNVTFSETTSAGGIDKSAPYTWTYEWDTLDSYSDNSTIIAYDNANNYGVCKFNLTLDIVEPAVVLSGVPSSWQNSDALIGMSCSESYGQSGCNGDADYYYLNTTGSKCPNFSEGIYIAYSSPVTVTNHSWFCHCVFDNVNNSNCTAGSEGREIKVDKIAPTTEIINPEESSWQNMNFTIVTNDSDSGGSGLNKCYYKVISNNTETRSYSEYACNSTINITVGEGMDCQDVGENICNITTYATDNAGNNGSVNAYSRMFSINWNDPVVWISDIGCVASNITISYTIQKAAADINSSLCTWEWSQDSISWNNLTGFSSGTCVNGSNTVNFDTSVCRANESYGICYVKINATDVGNNLGSGNKSFNIDNKAPTITAEGISSVTKWYKNQTILNVTPTVSANGCKTNYCFYGLSTDNGTSYSSWNSLDCNSVKSFGVDSDCNVEGEDKCKIKLVVNDSAIHLGNETEMSGAWDIDWTLPITTDDSNSTPWDYWYLNTGVINLTCSDTPSGCNSTLFCIYNADNESECTPSETSYANPTIVNMSCPYNSICKRRVMYYSIDTAENQESAIRSSHNIYIVNNSYVNNTNTSNSEITDLSNVTYSNITDSNISACFVKNSTVINSTLKKIPQYRRECRIINSVVRDGIITNSEVYNSSVDPSTIIDSYIENSTIINSTIEFSVVRNSNMSGCGEFSVYTAGIERNILSSGSVTYGIFTYYAPRNIDELCAGISPVRVGTLTANPSIAKNNTMITFAYSGADTGYVVILNKSSIDVDGGNLALLDDGVNPDALKDDAIYTATAVVNILGDENKTVTAIINDNAGNVFYANTTVVLDNTQPNATLLINGGDSTTITRHVVLNLNYSDANGVKECRYSNEDLSWSDWEQCSGTKAWVLSPGNGTKTVYYEVRDNAGNTADASDTITLQEGVYDLTPPTNLTVVDDGDYTNTNTSLHASWSAFDRESKVFYLYKINDTLGNCVEISGSCEWQDALENTEVSVTNLTLYEGRNYTFCVIAQNSYYINSSIVCSDGIIVDITAPNMNSVNSSFANNTWTNSDAPYINWTASDPVSSGVSSGIAAYSYILNLDNETTPDTIPEGNLNALENETSKTYTNLADGTYYFHVRAKDKAGNWGSTMHYIIKTDITPPTIPFMLNPTQNSSQGNITFRWSASLDYSSGILGYYITIIRTDTGAYINNNTWIDNTTEYSISAANGITYHAVVKARDNAGNIGLDSDQAGITYDNQPPIIIFKKPVGTVVSTQPILVVKTDERAVCYYDNILFAYTNDTHHEAKVTALNGQSPSYTILCRDSVGNQVSDSISFTVNTGLSPTSISVISGITSFFANQRAYFDVMVQSSGTNIGEIAKERFRVKIDNSYINDFVMNDNGNGNYTLSFIAPSIAGDYSIAFLVDDIESSTTTMSITELNLHVTYANTLSEPVKRERMVYAAEALQTIGLASDSRRVDTSNSTTDTLHIALESGGNAFIFVTSPEANVEKRQGYLKSGSFINLIAPSFGYRIEKEKYVVNTELTYPYISITGDKTLNPGTHRLVIRNHGLTADGKINISITTV